MERSQNATDWDSFRKTNMYVFMMNLDGEAKQILKPKQFNKFGFAM